MACGEWGVSEKIPQGKGPWAGRSRGSLQGGGESKYAGRGKSEQRPGGRGKQEASLGTRKEPPISGAWADVRG